MVFRIVGATVITFVMDDRWVVWLGNLRCRCPTILPFLIDNMSELVWGIKNGDLDQVRDIVEQKVNMCSFSSALEVW